MQYILASASPRRLALLRQIGIEPRVRHSNFSEAADEGFSAAELVRLNSLGKARAVAENISDEEVVIAADTVVVLDGKVIGKPEDEDDAKRILAALSGREHSVITGVTVICGERVLVDALTTTVRFRKLSDEEISGYVASGEPLDKAGAYGIQGRGVLLVEAIEGCYSNVVGLPLVRLGEMLAKIGVRLL